MVPEEDRKIVDDAFTEFYPNLEKIAQLIGTKK
jgi:hypothetical protein